MLTVQLVSVRPRPPRSCNALEVRQATLFYHKLELVQRIFYLSGIRTGLELHDAFLSTKLS